MTRRTGSADLPLHGGRVPAWLGVRMARLSRFPDLLLTPGVGARTIETLALDGAAEGPSWNELVALEHARSPELGGMSVFGPAAKTIPPPPKHKGQLSLFGPTRQQGTGRNK